MKYEDLKPPELETKEPVKTHESVTDRAQKIENLRKTGEAAEQRKTEHLQEARDKIRNIDDVSNKVERIESGPKESMAEAKANAYRATLSSIRQTLPTASRRFSKFIHKPSVERISDLTAKTIGRPSLTLGASVFALLGGGLLYFSARRYGFTLSGAEFLVAGLAGAIFGLLIEAISHFVARLARQS